MQKFQCLLLVLNRSYVFYVLFYNLHDCTFKCWRITISQFLFFDFKTRRNHYVKSVQIRIFFWSVFSRIQNKKNSVYRHFSRNECRLQNIKKTSYLSVSCHRCLTEFWCSNRCRFFVPLFLNGYGNSCNDNHQEDHHYKNNDEKLLSSDPKKVNFK